MNNIQHEIINTKFNTRFFDRELNKCITYLYANQEYIRQYTPEYVDYLLFNSDTIDSITITIKLNNAQINYEEQYDFTRKAELLMTVCNNDTGRNSQVILYENTKHTYSGIINESIPNKKGYTVSLEIMARNAHRLPPRLKKDVNDFEKYYPNSKFEDYYENEYWSCVNVELIELK